MSSTSIDITFPGMRGAPLTSEDSAKLERIQRSVNALAVQHGGDPGGQTTGTHGPAAIGVGNVDEAYGRDVLLPHLESLGIKDEVVVTFDDGETETRLYPREPLSINDEVVTFEPGRFPYRIPKAAGLDLGELFGCDAKRQYNPRDTGTFITDPSGTTWWGMEQSEDIVLNRAGIERVATAHGVDFDDLPGE